MPAGNKISGVGAIVSDGFDTIIQNNTIVGSYGYGILAGYYLMKSEITGTMTIERNIITGTRKALYPLSNDLGIANLTAGRFTLDCSENCLYGNVKDVHGVSQVDGIYEDPLFSEDYYLLPESPCRKSGYNLGCYQDSIEDNTKLLISCEDCDLDKIIQSIPYQYKIFRGV